VNLKWCHFTQDWGHAPLELHLVRDKEKREVDFLVTREKKRVKHRACRCRRSPLPRPPSGRR